LAARPPRQPHTALDHLIGILLRTGHGGAASPPASTQSSHRGLRQPGPAQTSDARLHPRGPAPACARATRSAALRCVDQLLARGASVTGELLVPWPTTRGSQTLDCRLSAGRVILYARRRRGQARRPSSTAGRWADLRFWGFLVIQLLMELHAQCRRNGAARIRRIRGAFARLSGATT
jgi:hypothetical protein